MLRSLPRRVFPAILLAFAIIVLTPTRLLADSVMPWVLGIGSVMLLGLIPVILIESYVLRRRLALAWVPAVGVTTVANVVSTLVGLVGTAFIATGPMPQHTGGSRLYAPLMFLLVPLFLVSWLVESPVAKWLVGRERLVYPALSTPSDSAGAASPPPDRVTVPSQRLLRIMFEANVASYGILPFTIAAPLLFPRYAQLLSALLVSAAVILAIPAEALVVRRKLKIAWSRAITLSFVTKLASGALLLLFLTAWLFPSATEWQAVVGLIGFIPVAGLLEFAIARGMLKPRRTTALVVRSRSSVWRAMFDANVASYLFLAGVVVVFALTGTLTIQGVSQASAIGSLRTINTSDVTYSSTYTLGFSPSLAALGGPRDCPHPSEQAACLIDLQLISAARTGYRFVYTPGPRSDKGEITSYSLPASPINGVVHGNFYYTDQTGVIRYNQTRPATAEDSPLAG